MPTLYLDENIDNDLGDLLRRHGIDAVHVEDVGTKGQTDPWQLAYASTRGLVVVTHNIDHFFQLHTTVAAHSGIIGLRLTTLDRLVVRLRLLLAWMPSGWEGRFIQWGALQARLETGYRPTGFTENNVRFACGR